MPPGIDPKLRAALDRLEEDLMDPAIGGSLACILSALRGPDEAPDDSVKLVTTCQIRSAAFPRLAAATWGESLPPNCARLGCWTFARAVTSCDLQLAYDAGAAYHFRNHIRAAAATLALPIIGDY